MTNIILVCAGGMSTSLLMNKMNEAAGKRGLEMKTLAMSAEAFDKYEGPCDILLLGPQIAYRQDQFKRKCQANGIQVAVIDMKNYGMMNGDAVLTDACTALGEKLTS